MMRTRLVDLRLRFPFLATFALGAVFLTAVPSAAEIEWVDSIEKTGALHEEANEPELDDKPRLVFTLNRQSASRLHEMILAINEMGRRVG